MTYTPGGAAVSWTVSIPATGGFELSTRAQGGNGQAGSLTSGSGTEVVTSGSIQYLRDSSTATSWTFQWTPPATNVGSVMVYVTGGTRNTNYRNSYVLTPAVSTAPTLTSNPASVSFQYQTGNAQPAPQPVSVTSSGPPVGISVSVSPAGSWLSASANTTTTPATVSVSVNATGLAAGNYNGSVSITGTGASNSPLSVPVSLAVSAVSGPTITVSPSSVTFNYQTAGSPPASQSVHVTSTGAPLPVVVNVPSGASWLSATTQGGTTPADVAISVTPGALAAGTYTGTVRITANGASNSPVDVGVTLAVNTSTPPGERELSFTFVVRDRQSGAADSLMLTGAGRFGPSGLSGGGHFTQTRATGGDDHGEDDDRRRSTVVQSGSWTATRVVSFTATTPATFGSHAAGILVLEAAFRPTRGSSFTGTLTIVANVPGGNLNTGQRSGVTLTINNGPTFAPAGPGSVSFNTVQTGGGGGGGDDYEDESDGQSRDR